MIFKSAFHQLKRNKLMNFLIIIQLAAVLGIVIVLVSLIRSRLEYYLPFHTEFSREGLLCDLNYVSDKELEEQFPNAEFEFSYGDFLYVNGEYDPNLESSSDGEDNKEAIKYNFDPLIYSDKWINAYTPEMESGNWISELPEYEENVVHVVVTPDNPYGFSVGDEFELTDYTGDGVVEGTNGKRHSTKVKICGVIAPKQYTIGHSKFNKTDIASQKSFFDMYFTFDPEPENRWGIIIPQSEYDKSELYKAKNYHVISGMSFIFTENMSDEDIDSLKQMLSEGYICSYKENLSEIRKNSFTYIKEQLYVLLPIALCIFLLTMITTISVVSISLDGSLRTYGVFYICGARWQRCVTISFVYSLMIVIVSSGLSLFALKVISGRISTVISFGRWEFISMLMISALYLLLSVIIPLVTVKTVKPRDVLKRD
ncbi:ABC transporter permease [Ruminococcus sp. NK3A76]|uniref:ABC transporter permease n=1 Tax=Ruminococcus sp. NK3A76 TaxID=877411 RepID=UPI0004921DE1|nr:ABC transporter permease [Ruminococcus sp. NK3A76]